MLMLHLMTYFRIKRLRLSEAYKRFLLQNVATGGTLVIVDCQRRWPVTRVGDRHVFQFGALGGASPEEFLHGGDRVERYLRDYGSHRTQWEPPVADEYAPEAEWGLEPALAEDVEIFARDHGLRVARLIISEPKHLSPFVAELYRWWNRRRNVPANRLVVESFILHEPYWTLRLGGAPFWCKFNMDPSAEALERYLANAEPFDHIHMMLFSHGVRCVGLTPIERWRDIFAEAKISGNFLGVDESRYPADFATFTRYHAAMKALAPRYPIPGPLTLAQLAEFIDQRGGDLPVRWEGLPAFHPAGRQPPGHHAKQTFP